MLRTGKTQQYRREALPVAEGKAICTARLRPVQGDSNRRETAQLLVAPLIFRCIAFRSRALHSQNWPDSLRKPNWTDTPALGFAACCLRFPLLPWNWPSFRYAPASGSREILSSRWRDDARQRVQTPRQNIASFAAPLSCRMLPGHYTTHIVRDPPVIYSFTHRAPRDPVLEVNDAQYGVVFYPASSLSR